MGSFVMPAPLTSILIVVVALPVFLLLAWNLWLTYIQTIFLQGIKWTLLEVKPPKDVFKSPLAMELALNSLYQTGGTGTWYHKYWLGNLRNYFSLEIVSTEGTIHFYIRTAEKFRKIIESQIYAQYPQAEVTVVEDYVNAIPDYEKGGPIGLWGCNFVLSSKESEVFPIKTYIDYGLDRAVGSLKEEERIDPITPMLEFMGSIGAGEHVWFQILLRGATDRFEVKDPKTGEMVKGKSWTEKAREVIKEYREKLKEKDADGKVLLSTPTKGQNAVVEAIERNMNKFGFDAGIRAVYIAQSEKFDANRIAGVTGMIRQYNTVDFNGLKPSNTVGFDLPWQDPFKTKIELQRKYMLGGYKHRSYFYGSFDFTTPKTFFSQMFTHPNASGMTPFILTTEELATLFHLPGRVAETASFTRIESKKSEPPTNLPV